MWEIRAFVEAATQKHKVCVFSKSWCPFCVQVKQVFGAYELADEELAIFELDEITEGAALQAVLEDMTGQRTVPNVFVRGEHVGGCDDTMRLQQQGALAGMLEG
eukprot:PRCOL_00006081-RA